MARKFALGADLGWVSQLEALGYHWVTEDGAQIDPVQACKEMGANAVRLRVFVDPLKEGFWAKSENETCMLGFCDAQSVVDFAKRVSNMGMDLMVGFHYSDHFADPEHQAIPEAWKDDNDDELAAHVYEHTRNVMQLLKDVGACPKWVQVGNEINHGIMWPRGSLTDAPEQLVRFLNAGYDAVKAVAPDCQVITHMAEVSREEMCVPFFDNFFAHGGKTDILGFSYYPYWYHTDCDKDEMLSWLTKYSDQYGKPVMIVEIGGEDEDPQGTYQLISAAADALLEMPQQKGLGIFYWEPEVNHAILPDDYLLGAAKLVAPNTLQYTEALSAYKKYV